ncbi:MAG: DoxX family protein [Pirellulales bacterium]|nr:DoxX family protein [Pirellulales bacterium]
MANFWIGLLSLVGRVMLCAIFLLSAVGKKLPDFGGVAEAMKGQGIPLPQAMLASAIGFLIVGSVMIVVGYKARVGAFLLLLFLAVATFYFHDFWEFADAARANQFNHFMKNLSLMGAMVFILANGAGAWSIDQCCCQPKPQTPTDETK